MSGCHPSAACDDDGGRTILKFCRDSISGIHGTSLAAEAGLGAMYCLCIFHCPEFFCSIGGDIVLWEIDTRVE